MTNQETTLRANTIDKQLQELLIQEEQLTGKQEVALWALDKCRISYLSLLYLQKQTVVTAKQEVAKWKLERDIVLFEKVILVQGD